MPDVNLQAMQNRADAQTQKIIDQAMTVTFFVYSIKFAAVAASATFTGNLQITADADFLIQLQTATIWDTVSNGIVNNAGWHCSDSGFGKLNELFQSSRAD